MEKEPPITSIIEAFPVIVMPRRVLDFPASWSRVEDRVVTLAEYLAAHLPDKAKAFKIDVKPTEIVPIEELGEDELQQVTLDSFSQRSDNTKLAIYGEGAFSKDELLREITNNTNIGKRLMQITREGVAFNLNLIKAGKMQFKEKENGEDTLERQIDLPDFPF